MAQAQDTRQVLRELQDRLGPVTLAKEHLLDVPEALQTLFPFGGLQRGQSIGFNGQGSWSTALALAGSAMGTDGWMAVVGVEELGLIAAAELGVRLDRLILIESAGSDQLGATLAVLADAVDVIFLNPLRPVGRRDARRLTARSRERGALLFHLDGGQAWPEALDITITATPEEWTGLGQGHGHLHQRRLSLTATGRRSAARTRRVSVLLPGPDGPPVPTPPLTRPTTEQHTPDYAKVS